MKRFAVFCLLLFLCAMAWRCKSASPAPGVPVAGSSSARARLAGRWEGEYHSADTGRRGTIVFEFGRGDVAYGDVLMMPEGSSEPLRPAHPEAPPSDATADTLQRMQVLKIRYVETSEGALTGALDPYIDPACSCEVQTTFNGTIHGRRIEGSFTSRPAGGGAAKTGQWSVQRR